MRPFLSGLQRGGLAISLADKPMAQRSTGGSQSSSTADPARVFFDSLRNWQAIEELITNGEAEGQYLECKAPSAPHFSRDLQAKLAEAISGFGNTAGGVFIWGVSTSKHPHAGDVLTQIVPLANCRGFSQQISRAIPKLAYPNVQISDSAILRRMPGDSAGMVITFIPKTSGDPIQSLIDKNFYIRSGDEFVEMPYEILKRMFASVSSPDLYPYLDKRLISKDSSGLWTIPIGVTNMSTAAGQSAKMSVQILNPEACDQIAVTGFNDASQVNPGQRLFVVDLTVNVYRGINIVCGEVQVGMKKGKLPKRVLNLLIKVYANNMRAREWGMTIQLAKKGFSIKNVKDKYLY